MLLRYMNTQIHKRWCEGFFVPVLLCIRFVTKAFLLRVYTDSHYKMTISYLCIRFLFVAQINLTPGTSIWPFLGPVLIHRRQKRSLDSCLKVAKKCYFEEELQFCYSGAATASVPPPHHLSPLASPHQPLPPPPPATATAPAFAASTATTGSVFRTASRHFWPLFLPLLLPRFG